MTLILCCTVALIVTVAGLLLAAWLCRHAPVEERAGAVWVALDPTPTTC